MDYAYWKSTFCPEYASLNPVLFLISHNFYMFSNIHKIHHSLNFIIIPFSKTIALPKSTQRTRVIVCTTSTTHHPPFPPTKPTESHLKYKAFSWHKVYCLCARQQYQLVTSQQQQHNLFSRNYSCLHCQGRVREKGFPFQNACSHYFSIKLKSLFIPEPDVINSENSPGRKKSGFSFRIFFSFVSTLSLMGKLLLFLKNKPSFCSGEGAFGGNVLALDFKPKLKLQSRFALLKWRYPSTFIMLIYLGFFFVTSNFNLSCKNG